MDTARQVLRYSIPGSILLLHGVVCYYVFRGALGVPLTDSSSLLKDNLSAVIVVLATVPLGFVVYQVYYFTYEPVLRVPPGPWDGRLVRRDRGGQILKTLDPEQIRHLEEVFGRPVQVEESPHRIVPAGRGPLKRFLHATEALEIDGPLKTLPLEGRARQEAYEDLWYTHWDVLRSAVDIAGSSDESTQVKAEYTSLSDIYHSLGASRTAVLTAGACVSLFELAHIGRTIDQPLGSLGGVVAISIMTGVLYAVFHISRGRTWRTAEASIGLGLRWLHWREGDERRRRT